MKELEERKQTLNDKIVIAQYGESQRLMKQEIVEYLTHSLRQEPRFLLQILVKSIIVYDDKIEIYFNFTERKNPDDSDDTDSRDNNYVNCSDILPMCPPRKIGTNGIFNFISLGFVCFDNGVFFKPAYHIERKRLIIGKKHNSLIPKIF